MYRTALISSPLIAIFENTPFSIILNTTFEVLLGYIAFSFFVALLIWWINILLIIKLKDGFNRLKGYLLSYTLAIAVELAIALIFHVLYPNDPETEPLTLVLVNACALNSIVLIISHSLILKSKKRRLGQELDELKIRHLEVEQLQLVQQLQPHFLFNALSAIKSLIRVNPDSAESYLVKLSDFLRVTISSNVNRTVTLAEELKFTQNYIELQQVRFGDTFLCEISIPEATLYSNCIPVYALQTLVENAIKHNAFTEEAPLRLRISYHKGSLTVHNNRIPKLHPSRGEGVGLENLNKRYLLICGERIAVDTGASTFTVTIKLLPKS